MATPGKSAKKEAKKPIQSKTSLISPFTSEWSPLPQKDMHFILQTLKDKLLSTGLEKKEEKGFHPWRKKLHQEKPAAVAAAVMESEPQMGEVFQGCVSSKNGWTNLTARRQLAIGINEVTKALERNELRLLLVCKSAKPIHMTNHLIALSATRGVPACQVPRLSQSLSEPLGLKSVLALGFKRCCSTEDELFSDTIDAIKPRVPSVDIVWLRGAAAGEMAEEEAEEEEDGDGERRGQKRKRESQSEKAVESPEMLQPLKVKRIVANPAKKKRKAKSKK